MAMFTKNRALNWGMVFLVVVNLGVLATLGVLFFRRAPGPEPAQRLLQDELQLTDAQMQQVAELKTLYQGKMQILNEEANQLKEAMLAEVFRASPDAAKVERFAEEIGAKQAALERLRFQHFRDLKALFQPEQTAKFQAFMRDLLRPQAPAGAARLPEQNRPPRPDEPPDRKRPPDQRQPPRPDEPSREPRPKE
jgi:Spy/CpxP family protein refolding chaperone